MKTIYILKYIESLELDSIFLEMYNKSSFGEKKMSFGQRNVNPHEEQK